jgi:hypothetical protein
MPFVGMWDDACGETRRPDFEVDRVTIDLFSCLPRLKQKTRSTQTENCDRHSNYYACDRPRRERSC